VTDLVSNFNFKKLSFVKLALGKSMNLHVKGESYAASQYPWTFGGNGECPIECQFNQIIFFKICFDVDT